MRLFLYFRRVPTPGVLDVPNNCLPAGMNVDVLDCDLLRRSRLRRRGARNCGKNTRVTVNSREALFYTLEPEGGSKRGPC